MELAFWWERRACVSREVAVPGLRRRPLWVSGGRGQREDRQGWAGVLTWARNLHLDSASYSQCDLDSAVRLSGPQSPPL